LKELCKQHDNDSEAGDEPAYPIDEWLPPPMRTAMLPPVHDHALLATRTILKLSALFQFDLQSL
jgi:hypothetical protein